MGDKPVYQKSPGESADISNVGVDLSAVNTTLLNEKASNNESKQVHIEFANEKNSSSQTSKKSSKEDSEVLDNSSLDGDVASSSTQNVLLDGSTNSIELVTVPEPSYSFITVSKTDVPPSEMIDCENKSAIHTMADPETTFSNVDKPEKSNFTVAASEKGLAITVFDDFEGETDVNTAIRSQYEHIYSTQHLEDIIESSKSEKVISLQFCFLLL